ncbi:hypothetical protein PVAND_011017 [Polypedilum vanderplanki]|uniref:Uncharacterized protein n=1 Tax=Polypedilum vanderplanki TaxID=319348 RepID=A0A9J6CHD2_POLVA|nr:hypothetical protein PVAND_011017 [Polypedilum vanderplanki]
MVRYYYFIRHSKLCCNNKNMKIDNIDNISNKEKSPDKAERSSSIEDLKKTQKFFDFNDLSNATALNDGQQTVQEKENSTTILDYLPPNSGLDGGSKLKKLLLNSDPEVANFNSSHENEKVHNNNEYLNNNNNNHDTSSSSSSSSINNLSANSTNIFNNNCSNSISKVNNNTSSYSPKSRAELNAAAADNTLPSMLNSNKKETEEKKSTSNTKKVFYCSECKEQFLQQNLFNHMQSVHNKFTCLYCYGFFVKIDALERHLLRKHKVQNISFLDEQSLENYFNASNQDKNLLIKDEDLMSLSSRKIKAVCCKCSMILVINEDNFHTHCCDGKSTSSSSKEKIQVVNRHLIENDSVDSAVQNNLNWNYNENDDDSKIAPILSAKQTDSTKENEKDVYCETAIQQWLQPNSKTTFNGASAISRETSSQNVPQNTNDDNFASWQIEEEKSTNNNPEKLVVPKLTLKIPKAFQNQQYNAIDSEEDSGDEEDDEEEDEDDEQDGSGSEESFKQNQSKSHVYSSSSLSDTENEESGNTKDDSAQTRPENMPKLRLTIKNLTSTPIVLECGYPQPQVAANDESENRIQNDVDMTECPMDLEPYTNDINTSQNSIPEKQPEVELQEKKIIIDGVEITPANEDILPHELRLDEGLDKMHILKLMKICLRVSFPFCLYCNHARKIVVNGKGLATHFIIHHRFHAFVDSITAEELHPEKFNSKFEQSLEELQTCYFNLDTYDDHDEEKKEGHVTISHDKLYECFQCRFQTPIHKELYLHNRKMHQKLLINCLMCKTSFHSYSELLCHICPGVPNKLTFNDYKFYCCLCNMDNIPSSFRLMVHLRKKHYACDVCLEKCSDQSKLSSHVWKHKLLHICYRCHIFYQNKADIMKHLFWKHGTEGIECKKCLQKKWPHVYHFCIPPASFTCQHCEMQFSRAMALKVHLRLHEDGAKYACTEMNCEKKFISKKLLIRHLERHQSELAAQHKDGDQERTEGTVIIPAEIADGFCTRTMPVVFKRFIKKPPIRKLENVPKIEQAKNEVEALVEKKEEKETKKSSILDLPETKLNLSESSDSDSSSDEENNERIEKKNLSESNIKQQSSVTNDHIDLQTKVITDSKPNEEENSTKSLAQITKVSTLSDSDEDDDESGPKNVEKQEDSKNIKMIDSMKNIMENLKNYQESQQDENKIDLKPEINEAETETKPTIQEEEGKEKEKEVEDKLPEKVVLHVCRSDHDYAKLYGPPAGTTEDDLEDMIKTATIDRDSKSKKSETGKEDKSKTKATQGKKKTNKNDDFSSSDSSSGSSSDSSSGSSSGSSSSSSSGSSSDSSSSEASSSTKTNNKPRNKKFTKKRSKKDKKAEAESEEEEPPRDPDDIIYESDLQTDETDTDEDFYDEHPLKMTNEALSEKRKQLGNIEGIIENSRPSTPSLPPDEKLEKRLKIKKRKRDHKKSPTKRTCLEQSNVIVNPDDDSMSYHGRMQSNSAVPNETPQKLVLNFKQNQGFMHTSTPIAAPSAPRIELHQANQIRQLLQSTQQQPILPILMEQQQQSSSANYQNTNISNTAVMNDYINVSHVSSAQSSRMNSDNESGIKRSQRRRIPNKFYGYTSDDDSMASQLTQNTNDPFKPIPPPVLTWDKEDLPSRTKSPNPIQQQQQQPRVAPLKLIFNGGEPLPSPPQIYDNYDSQHTKQLPINNLSMSKESSSVAYNSQQQGDSESSGDDDDQLHISEPGKRKRKLPSQSMYAFHTLETPSTVSNPQPPIPRLKLTIGSNNKIRRRNINPLKPPAKKRKVVPKSNTSSLNNSLASTSVHKSFGTKGSLSSYTNSLESTSTSVDSKGQKQNSAKDKQQKLEEAIMNTQQYFQRYNHAQVANDIPQDSTDSDGRVYCYCRRPYDDLQGMIGCDGPNCQIEWFHFECVGILVPPKGNWFCPQCQKEMTG